MKIKIYKDIIIHWTDLEHLIEILDSGYLKCSCSFTDNVDFGRLHQKEISKDIEPHLWEYGIIFPKGIKELINIEFIPDIIRQGLELEEFYPPYYEWEREYILYENLDLSLSLGIVYIGEYYYELNDLINKRNLEMINDKEMYKYFRIKEIDICFPDEKNNNELKKMTLSLGYDGIRYYDPIATGEKFVLYNTDKVELIRVD